MVKSSAGIRPTRAPKIIIRRADNYAVVHKVPYIWIDQECIDQDDPADKEPGIQAMDPVYRRAKHTVGLLDTPITSQNALDALSYACWQHKTWNSTEYQREESVPLLEIFFKLAQDPWFSRAWTY